jgi:hypothetical protein
VVIGGNERYISVCRKHYKQAIEQGSLQAIYGAQISSVAEAVAEQPVKGVKVEKKAKNV